MSEQTTLISARVSRQLYEQVKKVSESRGEDLSDFIRRAVLKELAVLNFLPREQKKALGVS
jgi:antitoxin component of RelBE/YafQ-DinJ toxin-antitoxin module